MSEHTCKEVYLLISKVKNEKRKNNGELVDMLGLYFEPTNFKQVNNSAVNGLNAAIKRRYYQVFCFFRRLNHPCCFWRIN